MANYCYLCCTSPCIFYGLSALGVPESAFILGKGPLFIFSSVIILVTGTIFAMWLGEKITDKGNWKWYIVVNYGWNNCKLTIIFHPRICIQSFRE